MEWAVPNRIWVLEAIATLPFAVAAVVVQDPVTRVIAGAAAVLVAVFAVRDRYAQVRLSADHDGVTVIRGFVGRHMIPWADVVAIRVDDRSRRGRSTRSLEIDTGAGLHLLSARELGADPAEVAAALEELRP